MHASSSPSRNRSRSERAVDASLRLRSGRGLDVDQAACGLPAPGQPHRTAIASTTPSLQTVTTARTSSRWARELRVLTLYERFARDTGDRDETRGHHPRSRAGQWFYTVYIDGRVVVVGMSPTRDVPRSRRDSRNLRRSVLAHECWRNVCHLDTSVHGRERQGQGRAKARRDAVTLPLGHSLSGNQLDRHGTQLRDLVGHRAIHQTGE